jgi:hypothetical protein
MVYQLGCANYSCDTRRFPGELLTFVTYTVRRAGSVDPNPTVGTTALWFRDVSGCPLEVLATTVSNEVDEVDGSLIALGERVISAAKLVRRVSAVKFEES